MPARSAHARRANFRFHTLAKPIFGKPLFLAAHSQGRPPRRSAPAKRRLEARRQRPVGVPNSSRESKQFSLAVPIKPVGFLPHVFKYFGANNRRQPWRRQHSTND